MSMRITIQVLGEAAETWTATNRGATITGALNGLDDLHIYQMQDPAGRTSFLEHNRSHGRHALAIAVLRDAQEAQRCQDG